MKNNFMQQPDKNKSSKKENKKVETNKQFEDKPVTEGTDVSINNQNNDTSAYPYKNDTGKQLKSQEEYIDRNNDSKDKS